MDRVAETNSSETRVGSPLRHRFSKQNRQHPKLNVAAVNRSRRHTKPVDRSQVGLRVAYTEALGMESDGTQGSQDEMIASLLLVTKDHPTNASMVILPDAAFSIFASRAEAGKRERDVDPACLLPEGSHPNRR